MYWKHYNLTYPLGGYLGWFGRQCLTFEPWTLLNDLTNLIGQVLFSTYSTFSFHLEAGDAHLTNFQYEVTFLCSHHNIYPVVFYHVVFYVLCDYHSPDSFIPFVCLHLLLSGRYWMMPSCFLHLFFSFANVNSFDHTAFRNE